MHIATAARVIFVTGVGLSAGSSSYQPSVDPVAASRPQMLERPAFHWPRPPLAGSPTPPRGWTIEIRGFDTGRCALPAGAAVSISREARAAAELSKRGLKANVTVTGGADGTPIANLRTECAARVPPDSNVNRRLARSRGAVTKRLFLADFDKHGGNRQQLEWTERAPVTTANIDRPHDRNAVITLAWRRHSPESANASIEKRRP
jgi:hypothetical protein